MSTAIDLVFQIYSSWVISSRSLITCKACKSRTTRYVRKLCLASLYVIIRSLYTIILNLKRYPILSWLARDSLVHRHAGVCSTVLVQTELHKKVYEVAHRAPLLRCNLKRVVGISPRVIHYIESSRGKYF